MKNKQIMWLLMGCLMAFNVFGFTIISDTPISLGQEQDPYYFSNPYNFINSSTLTANETDPIYSAWDKQTGINISESQIYDLDHFTNLDETDQVYVAWDKSTGISITESQISDLSHTVDTNETTRMNLIYDWVFTNHSNWDTAFSWGDHSLAGYLTSISDIWVNESGDTMSGQLVIQSGNGQIVSTNSGGSASFQTSGGQPSYISFGNTADIGISTDGVVSGHDYDGALIFKQKASNPDGHVEFIFIEESGDWRFALPSSAVDHGTYNPRSMIIAGASPNNESATHCSYWGFSNLDCDTSGTGADLGVQDDLEVLGKIYSADWSDVSVTESQISDLSHTVDTNETTRVDLLFTNPNSYYNVTTLTVTESQISDLAHTVDTNETTRVDQLFANSYFNASNFDNSVVNISTDQIYNLSDLELGGATYWNFTENKTIPAGDPTLMHNDLNTSTALTLNNVGVQTTDGGWLKASTTTSGGYTKYGRKTSAIDIVDVQDNTFYLKARRRSTIASDVGMAVGIMGNSITTTSDKDGAGISYAIWTESNPLNAYVMEFDNSKNLVFQSGVLSTAQWSKGSDMDFKIVIDETKGAKYYSVLSTDTDAINQSASWVLIYDSTATGNDNGRSFSDGLRPFYAGHKGDNNMRLISWEWNEPNDVYEDVYEINASIKIEGNLFVDGCIYYNGGTLGSCI